MRLILEVDGVTKDFTPPLSFGKLIRLDLRRGIPVRALEDVSFRLERGKTLAVLGPNGAGKTTLLKIIATLLLPDKGAVLFNGSDLEEKIKMSVGLVTDEERSFYWRLTGRQNLEFFAALYGLDGKAAKSRINELSGLFAVDYADKRFDSYSTGMKRRFALMRGLLHDPELLLLDEPTKSLDYAAALNLRNFIKGTLVKTQGKTVILATHHMDEALDFCDLFMILNKGKLRAMGTLGQLREQAGDPAATLGEIFVKLTTGS
ncbi:MAG: ABC transporter ATP-binding protein [Candidatus Omnitrophota bacterium]|jgi:ABC-2 type transport system ATP-binding protein